MLKLVLIFSLYSILPDLRTYRLIQASLLAQGQRISPANAGGLIKSRWIPGLGSSPGEGNGNPLQYSCLENPMDRGA